MSNIIKRIPPARGSERNKKAYEAWQRIWYKCKGEHKAKYAPQPILDERWYDFRAFEEWYEMEFSAFGEDDSPEIDKDLLSPSLEEKIYGPDNCVVIPNTLNSTIGIVHALMDMSRLEGIMRISMAYRDKLKPKVLTV